MPIIDPDGLEIDAVVPQCLDNQYVSDRIFRLMVDRGVDYEDDQIRQLRERDFRREFLRPLIYSSQVVIQRASLLNSDFLYQHYHPRSGEDLVAFASLIRSRAVVPYLYTEDALGEQVTFDTRPDGELAVRALLQQLGDDVTCVRLARSAEANRRKAELMATDFGVKLGRVHHLTRDQRNALGSELCVDPDVLQREGMWDAFVAATRKFGRYVFDKVDELGEQDRVLTRNDVYRDLFMAEGGDVAHGQFRKPGGDDPFFFELKKYVDLAYNANLPDHLGRYTFTPTALPSRLALQDQAGVGYSHDQIGSVVSDPEAITAIRRAFMASSQSAMSLPLLSDLSMVDVVRIRQLPEWAAFRDAQTAVLRDPLHCTERLPEFEAAFDQFQRALSAWYNRTYQRARTEARYRSVVTFALQIGGILIAAGSHLGSTTSTVEFVTAEAVSRLPDRIKGYAAKVMVGVYDVGRRQLDRDRAYTIELMQTNDEILKQDIVPLLAKLNAEAGSALPEAPGGIADQGIL